MERNSLFTKERADFAFHKINKYYQSRAYKQALAEIEANKELTGSSLNVGGQLKLNKIYTDCIVNIMLDAFEVDGDTATFASLMHKNHTNLELHASRNTFQLFSEFYSRKEQHPNYKSRNTYHNHTVEKDNSRYEDTIQEPVKKTTVTLQNQDEIKKDFLDSIEKPSFYYAPLHEDEATDTHVIKSNVDRKAIHDDFFDAIAAPSMSSNIKTPEDVSADFHEKNPFAHETEKRTNKSEEDTEKEAPIDSSLDDKPRGKASVQKSTAKKNAAKNPQEDYIKEKKEIIQNGEKITQTTHKSGGKVIEFTLGGPNEAEAVQEEKPIPQKTNEYKQEVEARQRQKAKEASTAKAAAIEARKHTSAENTSSHGQQNADTKREQGKGERSPKSASKERTKPRTQSQKSNGNGNGGRTKRRKLNPVPILALLLILAVGYGGFRFLNARNNDADNTPPITDNTDNADQTTPDDSTPDKSDDLGADPLPSEPPAEEAPQDYILPTNEREITAADLDGLSREQVRYAINEMFARHGWNFGGNGELYDYFSARDWYQPDMSMTSSAQAEQKFADIERVNLRALIAKINSM